MQIPANARSDARALKEGKVNFLHESADKTNVGMVAVSLSLASAISAVFITLGVSTLPVAAAGTETVLYSFAQGNNGYPMGRLYINNGILFGTGSGSGSGGGDGQVFELYNSSGKWTEYSLLKFDGADGSNPNRGLIRNSSGVLFGTTDMGDTYGFGNVFGLYKHNGSWVHNTIWPFGGTSGDGRSPNCDLIMDSAGALYGTTTTGGTDNAGTVFELTQSGGVWSETVLYSFAGKTDGGGPSAGLIMDSSGALYGTTFAGGAYGYGIVFELTQSGGKWSKTVLHSFGNGDGYYPGGALIRDTKGNLYGTTEEGGTYGNGTVFELYQASGAWKEKVLHNFTGGSDGGGPDAALVANKAGNLYGTTYFGGSTDCYLGCGTVFELTQSSGKWSETVLYSFTDTPDGANPAGAVILDKNGALYGTTSAGGADGYGTVWQLIP